jgi:hypothetical protein
MNHQMTTDLPGAQRAPQLESLLQVLSNVPSGIVLQEAATAKDATIDALITRFEVIASILKQAKKQRKLKRKDYADGVLTDQQSLEQQSLEPSRDFYRRQLKQKDLGTSLMEQESLDRDSKTPGNRARMPTEILRQLTQSGCLSTVDLAKTLLLTCKCYEKDLGREYVYEYLCKSRWRNITKFPPTLIADRGYYWLFRNLSRGQFPTIPPPTFDYEDMLFLISIRDGSGKEIVSEVVCGEQLDTLKEDGYADVYLGQSIGTCPLASIPEYANHTDRDEEYGNWSVTVHLFRLDENKCCCVHESDSCEWVDAFEGVDAFEDCAFPSVGFVTSTRSARILELNEGGKLLVGRIQELDRHGPERNSIHRIKFEVQLSCEIGDLDRVPNPNARSTETVALQFGLLQMKVHRVDSAEGEAVFDRYHEHHHGVTLPHLLEHLKGWDPAN